MVTVASGKLIRIRERIPEDSENEILWSQDEEIRAADPPAGFVNSPLYLSVETLNGEHIGYCVLYNWGPGSVELGIRIGDKRFWDKGYGSDTVNVLTDYCFNMRTMGINTVHLKTLSWNIRAIRCYEKAGFIRTQYVYLSGYEFIVMVKNRQE